MTIGKIMAGFALLVAGLLQAEEFQVSKVIHPVVEKLGPPEFYLDEPEMFAISTSSEEASRHVKQGVALFNAPWDFEAYRHFCAAAQNDPDCLMAYWGIVMSLSGNVSEFITQRTAAAERLLDLLEAKPAVGVEIEQAYGLAAVRLISSGAGDAAETFLKASERFPADRQSKLLGNFLMRDGYEPNGKPRIRQQTVNQEIRKLIEANGDRNELLSFWIMSLSEAPAGAVDLKKDALPVARKLARLKPDFPPFQLMASHVEARCGNASLAIGYALKARDLYAAYMKKQSVTVADCGGWVRAQVYLATLYTEKGDFTKALPIAKELAKLPLEKERIYAKGSALLLWEGRTLGARLYASRTTMASFDAGQALLDSLPKEQWFEEKSLVGTYRDGLVLYLAARKALVNNDMKAAKGLHARIMKQGAAIASQRKLARASSSYSEWFRAAANLGVLASELQGLIAEKEEGGLKLAAANWYRNAIDQQALPASLLPPSLPYPIEKRLAWFYIYQGKKQEALEVALEGLKRRPNHLEMLKVYKEVLSRLGQKEKAAQVQKTIKLVSQ